MRLRWGRGKEKEGEEEGTVTLDFQVPRRDGWYFGKKGKFPSPKVNEALPTGTIEVVWDVIFSRYLIGHLTGMYKH